MKVDIIQLLSVFDEEMPLTDEDRGHYWFKASCCNDAVLTVGISLYDAIVTISVYAYSDLNTAITSFHLTNCKEINVLDLQKKHIEILHSTSSRCFISLCKCPIIEYESLRTDK